jgi:hypothetical protein
MPIVDVNGTQAERKRDSRSKNLDSLFKSSRVHFLGECVRQFGVGPLALRTTGAGVNSKQPGTLMMSDLFLRRASRPFRALNLIPPEQWFRVTGFERREEPQEENR